MGLRASQLLLKGSELLKQKARDYGDNGKNFIEAAQVASIIRGHVIDPQDVAACLLGVKLSRIGNLTASGYSPLFEVLEDSYMDAANYIALLEELEIILDVKDQKDNQKEKASE